MKIVLTTLLIMLLFACEESAEPGHPEAVAVPATIKGRVQETIDVGSYTYIRLTADGQERWLATSPTLVAEGDIVQFAGGTMMENFYSTSLDRTFDRILFVGRVEVVGSETRSGMSGVSVPPESPDPHAGLNLVPIGTENLPIVDLLEGGISIAEIFSDPGKFEGKTISLRGRVIKVNTNIMGKNWVTVQDGTGVAPNDRLIATTQQSVSVGDELTLTGIVKMDVDLGYGYNYKVLLEGAVFE